MIEWKLQNKRLWAGVILVAIIAVWLFMRTGGKKGEDIPIVKVQRGALMIAVTSGGAIQSRDKVVVASELEGNNTVIGVIDEGVTAQAGDLLVEFDASTLVEKMNEQEIVVANANANLVIAEEKLGITKGDCDAALIDQEVALTLAKIALEKYNDGDYPQQIRQCEVDIALADEELKRASERMEWSDRLAKASFLTRTELLADELALQRKKLDLEMAQTRMSVLTNFTGLQQRATFESTLRKTDRAFVRTTWQNKATLRQVESELIARKREYGRATNRLAELNIQISKSKIYAPTNGIILYASSVLISRRQWWIKPLSIGVNAVERQELIYIPLESGMVVEMMIPEASLNKIEIGMPAKVKVDAFPGRVFEGNLVKIGILPDGQSSNLNPDLKLYKSEIECDFKNVVIRPGMSCNVELVKDFYEDALYVPVQCVVIIDSVPHVYVKEKKVWVPRIVSIGFDNNRMIHIIDGLKVGEEVMLAPPVKDQQSEAVKTQVPRNMDNETRAPAKPTVGLRGGTNRNSGQRKTRTGKVTTVGLPEQKHI